MPALTFLESQERKRRWSYVKHRKNPSGVPGRPRSPMPLSERRKLARSRYQKKLRARGQTVVRLIMGLEDAALLRRRAADAGTSPGALVIALLHGSADAAAARSAL